MPTYAGRIAGVVCAVLAVVTIDVGVAAASDTSGFSESFESGDWARDWTGWFPGPLNRSALIDGIDGRGLRVTIPAGSHYGTRFSYPFTGDHQPDTLFYRYWLRFDPAFDAAGTGKLPGPVGIYHGTALGGKPSTPDAPGWSARMLFGPGPEEGTARIGFYTYHLDQPGTFGEAMYWREPGVLRNGDWYCIEGLIRLNTPGRDDGVLQGWVDGVPAFSRRDLAFRREGEDHIRVSSFWFNVFHGGSAPAATAKQIDFDEVAFGPERVGCGGQKPVAVADVTGDGRDDAIELVPCADTLCWAVEPGGPVEFAEPRLTPSDARPGGSTIRRGLVAGNFTSDAIQDVAYIGRCSDRRACWLVHPGDGFAPGPRREWGAPGQLAPDGPLLAGDVNGDGLDDLVYRGRCDRDDCWIVQRSTGTGFAAPVPAGDGAYFSDTTTDFGIEAADLTGDGRIDLVYRGLCGDRRPCWRVQASTGTGFASGVSWGNTTGFATITHQLGFRAGDLNGDGRADLLYRGACGGSECWRALIAGNDTFVARYWGSEAALGRLDGPIVTADVDANGIADLVYRTRCDQGLCWRVHVGTGTGFVHVGSEPVVDVLEPRPPLPLLQTPGEDHSRSRYPFVE